MRIPLCCPDLYDLDFVDDWQPPEPTSLLCDDRCNPCSGAGATAALTPGSGALIDSSTTLLTTGALGAGDNIVATESFSALAGDVILADILTRTSWTAPDGTTSLTVSVTLNGAPVALGEFATFLSPPAAAGVVLTTYSGPPVRLPVKVSGVQTVQVIITRNGAGPAVSISSGHMRRLLYRSPPTT
jgi:hypothetical protein